MALQIPVSGYKITQGFGITPITSEPSMWVTGPRAWWSYRPYPFEWHLHVHPAIDMACAEGTPIYASERGIVTAAGWNGVSGLRYNVQIRPGTLYVGGHLRDLAAGVYVGAKVNRGQLLGHVGHTGGTTGPHLHFGVQTVNSLGSVLADPRLFFPGGLNANDPRILPYY
jgi:murein DD-endopeptidase MepM/ murein hydrolase activator NlpD